MEGMFEDLEEESRSLRDMFSRYAINPLVVLFTEKSLAAAKEHIRIGGVVFYIDATGILYTQLARKLTTYYITHKCLRHLVYMQSSKLYFQS